jgi:hypothetical protein
MKAIYSQMIPYEQRIINDLIESEDKSKLLKKHYKKKRIE